MNLTISQIPEHDCPRPASIAMEGYSGPGYDSIDRVVRVCGEHEGLAREHMDGLRPHRAIQGDPGHHVQCGGISDYREPPAAAEPATDPYVTDAATGWECTAGASLIAEAMTPGPGALGTMHGVIYVCPDHQTAAETLISATDCTPEIRDAPPGHRWDPWPCGHVTAFGPQKGPAFLAALLPANA